MATRDDIDNKIRGLKASLEKIVAEHEEKQNSSKEERLKSLSKTIGYVTGYLRQVTEEELPVETDKEYMILEELFKEGTTLDKDYGLTAEGKDVFEKLSREYNSLKAAIFLAHIFKKEKIKGFSKPEIKDLEEYTNTKKLNIPQYLKNVILLYRTAASNDKKLISEAKKNNNSEEKKEEYEKILLSVLGKEEFEKLGKNPVLFEYNPFGKENIKSLSIHYQKIMAYDKHERAKTFGDRITKQKNNIR